MGTRKINGFNTVNKASIVITILAVMLLFSATLVVAATDTVRPEVISVDIVSVTSDTDTIDRVHIYFSEAMDPQTIDSQTIMVVESDTQDSIIGTVTYDWRNNMATFQPVWSSTDLQQAGNEFTVIVTTGARDLQGNALAQNSRWMIMPGVEAAPTEQVTPTPVAPAPTGQVTDSETEAATPPATASTQNSFWTSAFPYILALVMLLLLALIIAALVSSNKKTAPKKSATSGGKKSPFGSIYPIETVEGIGPVYTKKLNDVGIENTKQLWDANTTTLAARIGTNTKTVENWQQMAELAAVHGIGPQYAELLERSGIKSIAELGKKNADVLLRKIKKTQNALHINIQGNTIGKDVVTSWISEASKHVYVK